MNDEQAVLAVVCGDIVLNRKRLDKLESEGDLWAENDERLLVIEGHISRIEAEINQHLSRSASRPMPLCPRCGNELRWAHWANDRPYLKCAHCGNEYLPPVLQPGD